MLGAPADAHLEVLGRSGPPGVAVGLCRTAAGGGEVIVVEAGRAPGTGALTLTGGQGPVMQESARTALSWLRANAARFGLDPDFHRHADVHLHMQAGDVPKEGASAGVTMAAALVSSFADRPLRGGLAMTGELTLTGHLLPVGGIAAKLLAAHRAGIDRVVLPRRNRPDVEHLGDGLRRVVAVDYVTRIDELLELVPHRTPAADTLAAATRPAASAEPRSPPALTTTRSSPAASPHRPPRPPRRAPHRARSDRARSVETFLDPGPPLGRPRTAHPAGDKGRHNRLVDPVAEP